MKRAAIGIALLVLFALALGITAAWLFFNGGLRGSGELVTEQRPLAPFSAVRIEGYAEVNLLQGMREAVSIEVPARQRDQMRIEVANGVLLIRSTGSRRWWSAMLGGSRRAPQITVEFRQLGNITLAGAVKLRSDRLRVPRLAVDISGAGTLKLADLETDALHVEGSGAIKAELAGRARVQELSISGAADYRAGDLVSDAADLTVSGAGRVLVNARKTLRVSLSGAGTVEYVGDPKVTEDVSGVGRIRRRNADAATIQLIASGD